MALRFDKRKRKKGMSLLESTKMRMRQEAQYIKSEDDNLCLNDSLLENFIEECALNPLFTVISTKLLIICKSLISITRGQEFSNFGDTVNKYERSLYKIFNLSVPSDDTTGTDKDRDKKIKLKEDLIVYYLYIYTQKNRNTLSGEDDVDSEEYSDDDSD